MQLWGNNLDGKIPNFIGKLIKLEGLALGGNNFNGQIPFTLSNLNQLIFLGLSTNNLHGKIPNSIGNLINLEYLVLGGNNFNGPFPCGVANLTKLAYLDISSNELMGPIPSNISGLHNLQTLHLHNNRLTGPIPQSISNLLNLTNLDLSSNNLSGVVELQTFSNLKQLVFLDLSYNSLSVSTINNINNTLPNLRSFRMTSCKIKEFPDFFKALENVQELDISSNEIHGKIPKWVGIIGKASLTYLNLSHNFLIGENVETRWQKKLANMDYVFRLRRKTIIATVTYDNIGILKWWLR
ncbi:hypothetical protein TEA_007478 [Camellia sinensis var. sinensis]|uniref:Disease resistance R13L4/SHOC-2-like LRR domain-containing protein n=1 Tax=Camellia sinensis var. sinensis TaxID=542762 RepID=A0A4S4EJC9_CAMSN|nr:hypothetical protein TEA_007478 [Camellia sinensis var. sinensis]